MIKRIFLFVIYLLVITSFEEFTYSQPKPTHIVIVILENHSFDQIVGSKNSPYINLLIKSKSCALFTQSYAVTHPSQPNYLALFSGSVNGIADDQLPEVFPFKTPNLGAELLRNGYSFAGYSEDLPEIGYNGKFSGSYARKHNPWVNWQDSKVNGIPKEDNLPFTSFPKNYKSLPDVSFVIPNQLNDMHDGKEPERIIRADAWLKKNLDGYIQWARKNNSLFVLTFDEDNNTSTNRITTLFIGQKVKGGNYNERINHFSLLKTIEKMYKLHYAGESSEANLIRDCWRIK